jgi:ATP-dependent Lon protease
MATPIQLPLEIPLFPLPEVVLFPGCLLPLHIFEPRYRQMLKSVMTGHKLFGVLNVDPATRRPAEIGCAAEIIEVEKLPDGRSNILTVGKSRFRVVEFQHEQAYLTGKVEWIEDCDGTADLQPLADKMTQLLRDVVRLSAKLADKTVEFPDDLPQAPTELSFWIAGSFPGLPDEQQALLEMQQTSARLKRETEILTSACRQLAARTALKDAVG